MQISLIKRLTIALALFIGLGAWLYFDEEDSEVVSHQILDGRCFGTYYHIKIRTQKHDHNLGKLVERELAQVSKQMSIHDEFSELSRINDASAEDWIPISPEMGDVLRQAEEIHRMSDGSFDPTLSPLIELWGFGKNKEKTIPHGKLIEEQLRQVGFTKIQIHAQDNKLNKQSNHITINLSAIAKGHGVDRVTALLKGKGYEHFIVEIGGEIYAHGHRSDREIGWNVAIERPDLSANVDLPHLYIKLHDQALATSGNYRNFFTKNEKNYAHTIDPLTGYPVENGMISVSVLCSDAMSADALATAIMAMPQERSEQFINKYNLAVISLQYRQGLTSYYISPKAREHFSQ